jgi:hypothetical protein
MPETFIKPPGGIVQDALKVLKTEFDRPTTAEYIPNLLRAAVFPNNPNTAAWSGEILHRIAEWHARQGDPGKAHALFELSLDKFDPAEALGPARDCRDFAKLYVMRRRFDEAFTMFELAQGYHAKDRPNQKGHRQQRVTQACVLEARVVADADRQAAVDELVDLAMYDIGDFCLRDQYDRVAFVLPYTSGVAKQGLHVRQLEINAARRRPFAAATSIARVVIDKELQVTSHVIGPLLRKEWTTPRLW